jgi:prolipoprotein diacylglyceryltransferase
LLTVLFILLYTSARFLLEFFRGDTPALLAGLTLHQVICILLFLSGSFLLLLRLRETREEGSGVRDQGSGRPPQTS